MQGKRIYTFGAKQKTRNFAKQLRRNQTPAEQLLWEMVRNRALHGLKFRRQHPLKNYIADFYCHELKLVIELDGSVHELSKVLEKDKLREDAIKALGLQLIRFNNDIVFTDPDKIGDKVLEIKKECIQDFNRKKTLVLNVGIIKTSCFDPHPWSLSKGEGNV